MFRNRFVAPFVGFAGVAALGLCLGLGVVDVTFAQQPPASSTATPKPAPAKPKPAPAAGLTPASVKSMIKAGLSEDLIAGRIKKENKPLDLTPDQMIDLKNAGASDRIIALLLDPKTDPGPATAVAKPAATPDPTPTPAPAPAPAPAPVPDPAPAPVTDPGPKSAAAPVAGKKRLAVEEFDYSAVKSSVQAVFNTQVDIGKGIRAMLVKRLDGSGTGKFTIVERAKVNDILKEQDFGASNRVKQGSNARIGRIKGADALLMGDIVIFGRDDKKKAAAGGGRIGSVLGGLSNVNKDDKAVVSIDFRLVDSETSEVIATGEARGESERKSKNWGALAAVPGAGGAAGFDMTSSNFAETIVGEATMDCVNKLADQLNEKAATLESKKVEVETRVADAAGGTLIIAAGANDGVAVGDRFEIGHIVRQVLDPTTKEVLDIVTEKVGTLVITAVRDRTATGSYTGQPAKVNDSAKKIF